MHVSTQRALLAVGLAAATAYIAVRLAQARQQHAAPHEREWISDHRPGPSGRMSRDELVDDAVEDSFPASDPPAFTAEVGSGAPRH